MHEGAKRLSPKGEQRSGGSDDDLAALPRGHAGYAVVFTAPLSQRLPQESMMSLSR